MILRMKFLLFGLTIFLSTFAIVLAQDGSGACSWHGGVNCSAGWQLDGSVICNDGWRDSVVEYEYLKMCRNESDVFDMQSYSMRNHTFVRVKMNIPDWSTINAKCMNEMYQNTRYIERVNACTNYTSSVIDNAIRNPECPPNSERVINGPALGDYFCRCVDGYYNYPTDDAYNDQGYCSAGEAPITQEERMMMLRQEIENEITNINNQEVENTKSELNSNPVPSGTPWKQAVGLVDNVADPDVVCKEKNGVNGKYLSTQEGKVKCGCKDNYSIGSDGLCSFSAKNFDSDNQKASIASSSQTASITMSTSKNDADNYAWLFFGISMILIFANGLRLYFTPNSSRT